VSLLGFFAKLETVGLFGYGGSKTDHCFPQGDWKHDKNQDSAWRGKLLGTIPRRSRACECGVRKCVCVVCEVEGDGWDGRAMRVNLEQMLDNQIVRQPRSFPKPKNFQGPDARQAKGHAAFTTDLPLP